MMMRMCSTGVAGALLLFASLLHAQPAQLDISVKEREAESWELAKKIWQWAEPGYKEHKSAALLANTLEKAGFKVQRGIAGIPTAFVATIGQGGPVIGIMGEYDALPGLSQDAVPFRKAGTETTSGHGCGHHLFGVASMSACLALGEQIRAGTIKGTLRFYGCPAEEGGSARVFMVRDGAFKGCDVVLHWHPSSRNVAGYRSNLARIAVKFRFHGKSAHAAAAPDKGRSALDAVALTNHAAELLREHVPDGTRIHHVITDGGGGAPNVVPEFAEVFYYVRHADADVTRQVHDRLLKCAQGGALATETRLEVVYLGGTVQIVPNDTLSQLALKHLRRLGDLAYDDTEKQFALRLQETLIDQPALESIRDVTDGSAADTKGSTDVSDVSWVVPTGGFTTACWVPGTPAHSWQAVACGGTSIGKKGMQLAARTLAAMAWDLFQDGTLRTAAQAERRNRIGDRAYRPLILPGQAPPLDYRDPARKVAGQVE
jgi:aminobenzoyl-glutamate utilization protein B